MKELKAQSRQVVGIYGDVTLQAMEELKAQSRQEVGIYGDLTLRATHTSGTLR